MTSRMETLSHPPAPADLLQLETLLIACVRGGASLGFMADIAAEEAAAYWAGVVSGPAAGARVVLVARDAADGRIVGTVQLAPESRPNGRHRAEVQKLLVLPSHRHGGLGTALMVAAEAEARARAIRLLFLDTSEGRGGARALYERLGYTCIGGIPGYALDPDGTPRANAIFFKQLEAVS